MGKIPISLIIKGATQVVGNKTLRKVVLGEYSDGSPRSIMDVIDGEILSPKDRHKYNTPKKTKKKNKKKKKKYKIDL